MAAKTPIGGSITANEVPCASCCDKPNNITSKGIIIRPPPTPTTPESSPARIPITIRIMQVEILII